MQFAILVVLFMCFAFVASADVSIATGLSIVLVTTVVHLTAQAVIGGTTVSDAFKSVGFSLIGVAVALFTLFSMLSGTGAAALSGMGTWAALGLLFVGYVFGFKWGLQAPFGPSAVVAVVSTTASIALFLAITTWIV